MKKILKGIIAGICCTACLTGFSSCEWLGGEKNDGSNGKNKTYIMEAEYTDLTGVYGGGHSSEASGVDMIYGNGSDAEKALGWSNGYFVAFTHKEGVKLTFKFNAEKEATGVNITLRLGSEMGTLTFNSSAFEVSLNGSAIDYSPITVSNSPVLEEMKFYDKTVAGNATLKEGENVLTLTVLANKLAGGTTAGPIIDCVKITTNTQLTWTDNTTNPELRGEI